MEEMVIARKRGFDGLEDEPFRRFRRSTPSVLDDVLPQ
jgi:hypothetical protein